MLTATTLADFPLFQDLPEAEVTWLIENSTEVSLAVGDAYFEEGVPPAGYYVVLEGELQVTRSINGQHVVLGTTPAGIMGGEIAILQQQPSAVTARAISPVRLMVLDVAHFRLTFANAPTFASRVLATAGERLVGTSNISAQQEKMAALGKLSAGLAHELNNPASAARRATHSLDEQLPGLQVRTLKLSEIGMTGEQITTLIAMQKNVIARVPDAPILSPLEQADREEEIADYLDELGVEDGWDIAPVFVAAGITADNMREFVSNLPQHAVGDILHWACNGLNVAMLLDEIENSTERISELVKAVKSYTYMDRAPTQNVDINENLVNTLKVMHYRVKDMQVVRQLDPNLPQITGRGGELNQVFTNIIDNAVDATEGQGQLTITTRDEQGFVMVEITDNGSGIPEDVLPRIFEPFYTTKGVGEGTGMGLELSYRIISEHNGTIEVQSQPGQTRFIIRLPIVTPEIDT